MITDTDIKKLKRVFATKRDLANLEIRLRKEFATKADLKTMSLYIIKEVTELFNATNERIDKVNANLSKRIDESNQRIDRVLIKIEDHDNYINAHERRLEKVEAKVFRI